MFCGALRVGLLLLCLGLFGKSPEIAEQAGKMLVIFSELCSVRNTKRKGNLDAEADTDQVPRKTFSVLLMDSGDKCFKLKVTE